MYGIRVHFDHRARRIGYPASTCGPSSTGALAAPNDHSAAHCSARSRLKRAAEMLHVVGRCAASMRRAADTGSHRWSHLGGPFAETSCASAQIVIETRALVMQSRVGRGRGRGGGSRDDKPP